MFFIGQDHIMYQLGDTLTYLSRTKSGGAILFRGASGYGKTELAKRSCNFLVGEEYQYCLGDNIIFDGKIWVHFIDEIHLLDHPEVLYPVIDEGKYVFIFATNFDSALPEALTNRCECYTFADYSTKDLIDIARFHTKLRISDLVIQHLINISGRNPRILIKTYIKGLEKHYYEKENDLYAKTDDEIIKEIDERHGIINGLDRISRQYLTALENLGGRASINLLAASAKLDLNTIKYAIEPVLLYQNLIKITNRGREIC